MSKSGSELEAGALVGGYRIDYLISRGGMGMVYRATNPALNRIYALKVLAPELAEDDLFRERFRRETRIAASLNHPNVVAIHDAGEHDGMLFLAMDLVDGTDLRDLIIRTGRLDPERALELLAQITSALDAAHAKGLVHRDVKPANILISVRNREEHAYLTDFGLAKRFDNATALTVQGNVVGTVDYMPPEQIMGNRTDARADIYALGCVLFQMLTGKVPYQREHSVATLFAHVYEPPPSLEGPSAASHPTLGPVIAKAMAKDPAERYLSAGDLTRDAMAALHGARYTGAPTIVATGEARPVDDPVEADAERTQAALETLQAAMEEPSAASQAGSVSAADTGTRASSLSPAPTEQPEQSASGAAATPSAPPQSAPADAAPPPETTTGAETTLRQSGDETAPRPSLPEVAAVDEGVTRAAAPVQVPPPPVPPPAATPPPQEAAPVPAAHTPQATGGAEPPAPRGESTVRRYRWPIAAGVAVIAIAAVAVAVLGSGSKKPKAVPPVGGKPFATALDPVPTNRVTATGSATVRLNGDLATVTVTTHGLLNGAAHAMHIHAGGLGRCPPASAARLHNGNTSISTTDGIMFYGDAVVSLTTIGDTSPRSIIDFTRYPTVGNIQYKRTIRVSPKVAAEIRRDNAVVVVHGIDYNGNGVYDNVLDRSDLSNSLPGESTAPALCGTLVGAKPTAKAASAGASAGAPVYTASMSVREISMPGSQMFWCSGATATADLTGTSGTPDAARRSGSRAA